MQENAQILLTKRLRLRQLKESDAPFIVALLNDPDFLKYIGDRRVRNVNDAVAYIRNGPIASYREHGFGMLLVERLDDYTPVGICGLVRRDGLQAPDLGFALMPAHRAAGFAYEASKAVLEHAFSRLGIPRVLAIVTPGNMSSLRLLQKLGMAARGQIKLPQGGEDLALYELTNADRGRPGRPA